MNMDLKSYAAMQTNNTNEMFYCFVILCLRFLSACFHVMRLEIVKVKSTERTLYKQSNHG